MRIYAYICVYMCINAYARCSLIAVRCSLLAASCSLRSFLYTLRRSTPHSEKMYWDYANLAKDEGAARLLLAVKADEQKGSTPRAPAP